MSTEPPAVPVSDSAALASEAFLLAQDLADAIDSASLFTTSAKVSALPVYDRETGGEQICVSPSSAEWTRAARDSVQKTRRLDAVIFKPLSVDSGEDSRLSELDAQIQTVEQLVSKLSLAQNERDGQIWTVTEIDVDLFDVDQLAQNFIITSTVGVTLTAGRTV